MAEYDRDREHLRLLGIGYYITAGTFLVPLALILILGIIVLIVYLSGNLSSNPNDATDELSGIVLTGVLGIYALAGGVLNFLAGRWLRKCKHRTFCYVLAALNLLIIPYGTAIGICTFYVLNREHVKALFAGELLESPAATPSAASE